MQLRVGRVGWVSLIAMTVIGCGGDDQAPDDGGIDGMVVDHPALDLPMREQIRMMETMALSSAELTAAYLDRIALRDSGSMGVHAILALDPSAPGIASAVDAQRGTGRLLQGAVIVLKDNIDATGIATTAGSIAMANNIPAQDAAIVAKLRAANAVLIGKANLSEWANFRGFGSTSGWSSRGGQTRHALIPAYNPCGSSSGSAAAVASGTVSASLGSETDGSIVCPASINGVVGFKPTVGLVSRTGLIPVSSSQDTIGPITRDVGDAARLLGVIAGPDAADPATAAIPTDLSLDFETPLATATLAGKRIGVVRSLGGFGSGVLSVFEAELQRMAAAGAILVDVQLPAPSTFAPDEYTVLLYEFKDGINTYLASHARANQPATLEELITYNNANSPIVMPHFGQQIFIEAQATTGLTSQTYLLAKQRARTAAGPDGILAAMTAQNLDVLVAPTMGPAWVTNYGTGDRVSGSAAQFPAVAGYPHLTVPMTDVGGIPAGLSFFAGPWEDGKVLALGYAYEQLRGASRATAPADPTPRPAMPARHRAGM